MMQRRKIDLIIYILILTSLTLLFIGCGQAPTPPPTVTVTPSPTASPTVPPPSPTPTLAPLISDVTNTLPYTHTSQRFRIEHPPRWEPHEQANGVIFIEPTNQGGYSLFFNDVQEPYSPDQLIQYLATFMVQNFAKGDLSNLALIKQEMLSDGTAMAQFSAPDPLLGQAVNEIRVSQVDTIVFILLLSTSEEQWHRSAKSLQTLAKTFVPLDTTTKLIETADGEPPVWTLIGPTTNTFGFLSPSDWETVQQNERSVIVKMPDNDILFEATLIEDDTIDGLQKEAEGAVTTYLEELQENFSEVETRPIEQFPLDTTQNGATADFLYLTPDEVQMAGSVVTAVQEEQIYRIVFVAPAQYYAGALEWFNPMLQSFKFLSPKNFLEEE